MSRDNQSLRSGTNKCATCRLYDTIFVSLDLAPNAYKSRALLPYTDGFDEPARIVEAVAVAPQMAREMADKEKPAHPWDGRVKENSRALFYIFRRIPAWK